MNNRWIPALLFALMAPAMAEPNAAKVPTCPSSYPLDGVALTKVPVGWEAEVYERFGLESVTVATEPNHEGEIIPVSRRAPDGGSQVIFDGLDSFAKPRWLVCGYGYGSAVRLYRRLPSGIKRCTANYVPVKGTTATMLDKYVCR